MLFDDKRNGKMCDEFFARDYALERNSQRLEQLEQSRLVAESANLWGNIPSFENTNSPNQKSIPVN